MIRKEPERGGGRRPLLAAFVGNNRQMLNDIRDSLSHLRKSQLEGDGDVGMQPGKTELSQSTPNLADKAATPTGTKKGLENHTKTLAEIRETLRPFQNAAGGRDRPQVSSDGEVTRSKIQQIITNIGVDEGVRVSLEEVLLHLENSICPTPRSGVRVSPEEVSLRVENSINVTPHRDVSVSPEEVLLRVEKSINVILHRDIAVRALKICSNVEGAVELLCDLIEHTSRNGSSKISAGLPSYPVNRRPSFESKYGPSSPAASETNSVRSDSPSLTNVPLAARQTLVNGHQTPPPLPPRAPISTHPSSLPGGGTPQSHGRGHTPPPLLQGEGSAATPNGSGPQASSADIPAGHVQQMIKRMSPGQFRGQVLQNQTQPAGQASLALQQQQQRGGLGPLGGMSPRQVMSPPVYNHGHGATSAQAVTGALTQQLQQGLVLQQQSVTSSSAASSNSSSASSTPALSGHRLTINLSHPPPPPYSQAQSHAGGLPPHKAVEHSHMLGDYHHLALTPHDSPLNLSTASSSMLSDSSGGGMVHGIGGGGGVGGGVARGPGLPVVADRRPMAPHAPVIMQSVKSKEVHKPVPQTATGPMSPPPPAPPPPPAGAQQHSYISQVQAQINMSAAAGSNSSSSNTGLVPSPAMLVTTGSPAHPTATTTTTHTRNLQIHISSQTPHHVVHSHPRHAPQYATEPVLPPHPPGAVGGRPTIQIHIPSGAALAHPHPLPHPHHPNHMHFQNVGGLTYEQLFHRAQSDTLSTSRSDSPVSRTTSQSPLSMMSTTSTTPSNNSDIPDKPPPPYPFPPSAAARQPPLPPRVPLQNKPPPPPPPGIQGVMLHVPVAVAQSCQHRVAGVPSPLLPQAGLSSLPPGLQNGQAASSNETASEQGEDTDTETVSSSDTGAPASAGGGGGGGGGEKHRCMSPMPQRKPEAWERDRLRRDTKVCNYSPQAFKFYMEQHVENVLKIHQQRLKRRTQLENEMAKVNLSEEAAHQMRRMLHQKESNYIRLKRAKMDKSMFEKIKTLGVGAFGEVALCRKRDTGMLYAMKTLRKSDVLKRNQVAHVKAERDILAEADNEWVVKLYYSFQDHNYLYFVMDYVPGGDLMGLLIRMEILDEPLARFYVAELVQAIESVHRMGFIHRDIKPDNILIDRNGHIKLTDFGLCTGFRWTHNSKYYQGEGTHARQDSMEVKCQLDEQCQCEILKPLERRRKREQRCLAHSLVGTPNYIAPEVLLRSGYTSVCDWWSVGVILFEMLVGRPPFYANTPAETQYKVINWRETLKIPRESNLSQAAKDLILKLCCGPDERLGLNGAVEIKAHLFFSGINFETLRKQQSPYVPNIRHATDTSNFDPVDPDKLRNSDSEENKKVEKLENGKHPEHAFFEFTFRRFFDDGGHPMAATLEDPDSNSPVYV